MSLSTVQSLRQPYGNPMGTLRHCSRLHAFMWGRVLHDGNLQHLDDACMLSGPSAIAAVILLMAQEPSRWTEWTIAVFVASLISGIILVSSEALGRKLGNRALTAIERLMGIFLIMISVDFILDGIKQTFNI